MEAPVTKAPTAERVIVLPEAKPPRRMRRGLVLVVVGAVLGLVVGGLVGTTLERDRTRDAEVALANATAARDAAEASVADARAQASELSAHVGALEERVSILRHGLRVVTASKEETRALLEQTQSRSLVMLGPPLEDGRYLAGLEAVGAGQSPPRVLLDLQRWLTGRRAVEAARADGAIGPDERLSPRRYVRNTGATWRLVEVNPGATVRLRTRSEQPTSVTLAFLEQLFDRNTRVAHRITRDPFWIVVEGGRVTALRQQPYRAP